MIKIFWFLFYNIFVVPSLYLLLRFAGMFNSKVRRGIQGRKRVYEKLILDAAAIDKSKRLVWFHSSSLGEFEQAKPIIERLKKEKTEITNELKRDKTSIGKKIVEFLKK